jgi:GT2 family glycosyltransferase
MIKVSIIIPTYNRSTPFINTLKSLFAQNYKNFEIIVVDQSDKKFERKEKFLKLNHERFTYLTSKLNSASSARNIGLKQARGEIILFLDDDVVFNKDLIANHIAAYSDKNIGAVVGRVVSEGQTVELERRNIGRITPWGSFTDGFSSKIPQEVQTVITCNASWRKSVLDKIGDFDQNFTRPIREDTDLSLRTRKAGYRIKFAPKAEVIHKRADSGGFRMSEGRSRWYLGFFKSETYFSLKWIKWYWWPVFWTTRWQWFIRSKSILLPWRGINEGIKAYRRWSNANRS